ncbi:hypothetical protein Clacol_009443 [Clathrus columnatus]|uniref:Uncharacterized protein n=1 Tax=Clathrus columnatus TaxID=1419009 RepID=A0AAV5ANV0_9AGAM|nr:hypothetical protein Clacol_009443 [Clathrus columnatus]
MSLIPDPMFVDSTSMVTSATSSSLYIPPGQLPMHFQDPAGFDPALQVSDQAPQQLDPNSPEMFKSNIHIAQQHVLRIQHLAQNAIASIERAYTANSSYAIHASGEIISLRHAMDAFTEFLRSSGIGSLPPRPCDPNNIPSESQLVEEMTRSVQELFEKRQRLQENASAVVSLLASLPELREKTLSS